jgi:uncharacterized SAM-binding protein YcdF (DUF218 family)
MFVLKQFLKALVLPPLVWMCLLLVVLICWRRRWARKLLFVTFCLIVVLHSGICGYLLRYPLESRYPPLLEPTKAGPYDAIVVLTGSSIPAGGMIPFPSVDGGMFRRLEETWRLYRIQPKPIIVSGGHVNPFTPSKDENKIGRDYLTAWGVPERDVIGEDQSRDTFESAVNVDRFLREKGWKRYLLVTSAAHMPRSMLVFTARTPEPIPAPADFTLGEFQLTPLDVFPSESDARGLVGSVHEYLGLANYYWRIRFSKD